jgi:hypothetical protein
MPRDRLPRAQLHRFDPVHVADRREEEIFRYVPFMAGMAILGAVLAAVLGAAYLPGVA